MKEIEAALDGKQEKALLLVLKGMNDVAVGKAVGVTRQTVSNWRHYDSVFIDTLAEARRDLREKQRDSINGLVDKALEVVRNAMDDEDSKTRLQAAKLVLSMAGLNGGAKGESQPSERELFIAELGASLGKVSKELGYTDPSVVQEPPEKPLDL